MRASRRHLPIIIAAGLAVAWAVFLLSVLDPRGRWVAETFGPSEDGSWIAVSIDGHRTNEKRFTLFIDGGEPNSGYDGCNGWGRSEQPGMIVTELEECPPDPLRTAYWALATDQEATLIERGDRLTIRSRGHVGTFVRAPRP